MTDKEILDIYKASPTATEKIAKNQIRWRGYASIAEAAVAGYQGFIQSLISPQKK